MNQLKERFTAFLNEKNFVTDQLAALEQKTGVKKELIVLGTRVSPKSNHKHFTNIYFPVRVMQTSPSPCCSSAAFTASFYCPFQALWEPKVNQQLRRVIKCRNIAGKRSAFNNRKPPAAGLQGYFYLPPDIICMVEMKGDPGLRKDSSTPAGVVFSELSQFAQCKSISMGHLRGVCCSTQLQGICDLLSNQHFYPVVM